MSAAVGREKINGILLACLFVQTTICSIISTVIHFGYMSPIVVFFICVCFVVVNGKIRFEKNSIMLFSVLILLFAVSAVFNGVSNLKTYLEFFVVFGLGALVAVSYDFDMLSFMKTVMYIGLIFCGVYILFMHARVVNSADFWSIQMGLAFSMLPPYMCALTLILFRKEFCVKKITLIFSVVFMIMSVFLVVVVFGTRGALLSFIVGTAVLFILKQKKLKRIVLIFLGATTLTLLVIYIKPIWSFIYSRFPNIPMISKMQQLLNYGGDVTNGRTVLYKTGLEYFYQSPIIGNGIGYFEQRNNGAYVHQLFLQILIEFGIIGLAWFLWLFISCVINLFKTKNRREMAFTACIFCTAILPLITSSVHWESIGFWIWILIEINKKHRSNTSNNKIR